MLINNPFSWAFDLVTQIYLQSPEALMESEQSDFLFGDYAARWGDRLLGQWNITRILSCGVCCCALCERGYIRPGKDRRQPALLVNNIILRPSRNTSISALFSGFTFSPACSGTWVYRGCSSLMAPYSPESPHGSRLRSPSSVSSCSARWTGDDVRRSRFSFPAMFRPMTPVTAL